MQGFAYIPYYLVLYMHNRRATMLLGFDNFVWTIGHGYLKPKIVLMQVPYYVVFDMQGVLLIECFIRLVCKVSLLCSV